MGSFYPYSATLLGDGGGSITYTGPTYRINNGNPGPASQLIQAQFNVSQIDGVGAGTVDAEVQGSWDNATWTTLASMTQLTAEGSVAELQEIASAAPYLRVKVTPGGDATFHAAHIAIISTNGITAVELP